MSKMEIECVQSIKNNLEEGNNQILENIIRLVNPSIGEKFLLFGNIKNAGKYIKKMGADVKILINENQVLDSKNYLQNDNCEFITANIENMPFRDEYFDKVIFLGGFHNFKDEKKVFHELVRVLKKSGQILIKESGCKCISYKVETIKSRIVGDYCKHYNPLELTDKLKKSGFEGIFENVSKNKYVYIGTKIS